MKRKLRNILGACAVVMSGSAMAGDMSFSSLVRDQVMAPILVD